MGSACCAGQDGNPIEEVRLDSSEPKPLAPISPKAAGPQPGPVPEPCHLYLSPQPHLSLGHLPPVPEPAAPKSSPPLCLQIEFDVRTVQITEKPLGLTFIGLCVKTLEQGGSADRAGVQTGWVFKKIGGVSVEGRSDSELGEILRKGMDPLRNGENLPPGLLVIFVPRPQDQPSYTKKVVFTKKPLGLKFGKAGAGVVSEVVAGSEADRVGVKVGWQFKVIDGTALTPKTSMEDMKALLMKGSASLTSS